MIGWTRRLGAAGQDRSRVAVSGEASEREGAGGPERDPGASWTGAGQNGAGQHGPRTGQELRGAAARMQCTQHESGESQRTESGVANGIGAIAGGNRITQRAHPRVRRTDREAGGGEISASGAAEAGQRSGYTD